MTHPLDILGLIGVTIIFTWSVLFKRVRAIFPTMFECAMCMGFEIGLVGSLLRKGWHNDYLDHLYAAATVSLLSFATSLLLERLQLPLLKKG